MTPPTWTNWPKARAEPSSFAGIPISIKYLFDIKGQVTRAGSRAQEDSGYGTPKIASEKGMPIACRIAKNPWPLRAGFV